MNIPKYRAWHKQRKIMMPVLEINFDPEHGGVFVEDKDGHYCGCRLNMDLWPWSDIELMEYIGRRDCNGKEIYGDDIALSDYAGHPKRMPVKRGSVSNDYNIQAYGLILHDSPSEVEVIGNIWQNSDLLPQEPQS